MAKAQSWACLVVAVALGALPTLAQDKEMKKAAPAEKKVEAKGVKAEIIGQITAAQEKLAALAEATPAEKYSWRPGTGVRSTGEVFLHVAGGNYFLGTFLGVNPPAGLDVRNLEKEGATRQRRSRG